MEKRRQAIIHDAPLDPNNLLAWYDRQHQQLGGNYEPASAQLLLSFAAIFTTTDLICQVILDLAERPELLQALREEITSVIPTKGWQKTSLYKLALLDSVLKESQRLKPVQIGRLAFLESCLVQLGSCHRLTESIAQA